VLLSAATLSKAVLASSAGTLLAVAQRTS